MNTKKLCILCLFLFCATFCLVLSISAYQYAHKGLVSVPSTIYISDAVPEFGRLRCQDAMNTWNTTCFTYDCLYYGGTTSVNSYPTEDNTNTITYCETFDYYLGETNFTQKKYTFLWQNWYLKEFDINMNPASSWYMNSSTHGITLSAYDGYYDFQSVILHELGHALGLDHSADSHYGDQPIVMYSVLAIETTVRDLSEDDRLGVVNLY